MVPINTYTYSLNLDIANANPDQTPKWTLIHDFVKEYNLQDMSPN